MCLCIPRAGISNAGHHHSFSHGCREGTPALMLTRLAFSQRSHLSSHSLPNQPLDVAFFWGFSPAPALCWSAPKCASVLPCCPPTPTPTPAQQGREQAIFSGYLSVFPLSTATGTRFCHSLCVADTLSTKGQPCVLSPVPSSGTW